MDDENERGADDKLLFVSSELVGGIHCDLSASIDGSGLISAAKLYVVVYGW